ncbi:hypothetical protein NQZ68_027801 [Dissostichus eleginoides]|nr:hypothetical protein NQZ68_027801 [Dissostichus eleginoides]
MTQHIYSSLPATHCQIVFYTSVRSLSHRPLELPANLPASPFTIPACLILNPACLPPLRTSIVSKPA